MNLSARAKAPHRPGLLTLREAAARRNVNERSLLNRVAKGDLVPERHGQAYYFTPEAIDALVIVVQQKWNPTEVQKTEFRRVWAKGGYQAVQAHFSISTSCAYYWAAKLGVPRRSYNLPAA